MSLVGSVAVGVFLAVALVLVLTSLKQVDQNEYGLVFNWMTKQIGNEVHHGGLHFIGFWNTFVTFPATVRTIEFSDRQHIRTSTALHTRTKEGLALELSVSFQYTLHPDGIPALYALTNVGYESLYVRIARDQLLEVASDYEGPQYWVKRKEIGDQMREKVNSQLQGSHASLWDLELLRIDLPDQYEASITKTQVQQQMVKTRQNEQLAAGIRADTEIMRAEYERRIRVVEAGADANYTFVTELADGKAAKRRIAAEAEALRYIRNKLALSTAGAVEYQQLGAYAGLVNATVLANVGAATPVISAVSPASRGGGALQTSRVLQEGEAAEVTQAKASGLPVSEPAVAGRGADLGTAALAQKQRRSRLRATTLSAPSMLQVTCRVN
mmetsp:Transcript_28769/g.90618  ORF Transcript_28769/g.90618 Transcript_28769/m.90618 type:complete len:384 (+) Transcript_28769:124-1275(+)